MEKALTKTVKRVSQIQQQELTPKRIVEELDKYIVGQEDAKRHVAIALRNRWRWLRVREDMKREIVPSNILMIGATGVGKTEIARRLAKLADASFVKVEASKFTEVGYVGRDVESMVRDLVEQSVGMVKQQKREKVREKAMKTVENTILDALIPPVKASSRDTATGEGDAPRNERTRENFRKKIRQGDLDKHKIDVSVKTPVANNMGMIAGGTMDEVSMMNLQEMLSGVLPKRSRKRKVTIADAKRILMEEEVSRLIDMEEVKAEALLHAQETGIIFIDEIDKIVTSTAKGGGPDVSREGVQRDLLPIVEGSAVSTKYGVVHTDHMLYIAAGAFHLAKPSDLIPELQGRFPIRVELKNLTQGDFLRILKEPRNALTRQYRALLEAEEVDLAFSDKALEKIAHMAYVLNTQLENIGARRLHTVMSKLLNDLLFDVPDTLHPPVQVHVDEHMVEEKLADLVEDKDLSRYIL